MTERENLPVKSAAHDLAATTEKRGSLVRRGLVAVLNGTRIVQAKDNDALYLQARAVYNLLTDDGTASWFGECHRLKWLPKSALDNAFKVFKRLAEEEYGRAYYPLSTLYKGDQGVDADPLLAKIFADKAFWWCLAHKDQDDPEIWNDLGNCYFQNQDPDDENERQAFYWIHKATERNHAGALYILSLMYEVGYGVEQDYHNALYFQTKSAEQGNLTAIILRIIQSEFHDPDHEPDYEQALYWYRKAAERGYPWTEADFGAERFLDLGMHYRWGCEVNNDKAHEYFLKAAKLGHAEAQYELSGLLSEQGELSESEYWLKTSSDNGFGPAQIAYSEIPYLSTDEAEELICSALDWYKTQAEMGSEVWQFEYASLLLSGGSWYYDHEEGLRWLISSAENGYRRACRRLGEEYIRHENLPDSGIFWLEQAADLGDAWSCGLLGDYYLLGCLYNDKSGQKCLPFCDIGPEEELAIAWYERGIDMGDRRIAFLLGHHYLTGEHLEHDPHLAEKWLLHSAKAGYRQAQIELGSEYASGDRLPQHADAAIHWLELAAEDQSTACLKLAEMYLEGIGVRSDFEQAIRWLTQYADTGTFRNDAMKIVEKTCFDGRFSAENESAAKTWLEAMADTSRNEAIAELEDRHAAYSTYKLAELYELGLGVERDMDMAVQCYKRSAGKGHYGAKKRLGELGLYWGDS